MDNLYEGVLDKAMMEVAIQLDLVLKELRSGHRRDLANLGLRKGKKQLPRSLEAAFDLGTILIPPNTRSKVKEGSNIKKRVREGTRKKVKEKTTLAGIKPFHKSATKEQVGVHLKNEKNPPFNLLGIFK